MIGWTFAPNGNGRLEGISESGIETYKGNPIESLAREVIQNSLDAAKDININPVKVEFELFTIYANDFPGYNNYMSILKKCKEYGRDNKKTQIFFEKAIKALKEDELQILRVGDYNTRGLTGSNKEGITNWTSLIKGSGMSNKAKGSGGSYGIGKKAPFVCSDIRTIFYSTKDIIGVRACQGVTELISHKNENNELTQGVGFYGLVKGINPILEVKEYPSFILERNKCGTDIYILAFNESDNWKTEITKSIIENYMVAILENKLAIKVGDILINLETYDKLINQYFDIDSDSYIKYYYDAYTSKDKLIFNHKYDGLGEISLHLLSKKGFPKRVAMHRETGMKIFDKGHFKTLKKFAGVFIAFGEDLNEELRMMEPPEHDAWEPSRHDDEKKASSIRSEIYKWINGQIKGLTIEYESEVLDIDGLSQFLPDDSDLSELPNLDSGEQVKKDSTNEVINITKKKTENSIVDLALSGFQVDEGNSNGNRRNHKPDKRKKKKRGKGPNPKPSSEYSMSDEKIDGEGKNKSYKEIKPNIENSRIFAINKKSGIFKNVMTPDKDATGYLVYYLVGEDIKRKANIQKAQLYSNTPKAVNVKNNKIGPINFEKDKRLEILIHLERNTKCLMEVVYSEN